MLLSPLGLCGISIRFQMLSPCRRQVLTRYSPVRHLVVSKASFFNNPVRLACVRHAASVRPEPGSNSPFDSCFASTYPLFLNEPVARSSCTSVLLPSQLPLRFGAARLAPLPSRSSVFPCHGASPLSFRPAPRFPSRPPSRGATRESILRALEYVKRFFIGRTASCEVVFCVFPRGDEIKNFYFS